MKGWARTGWLAAVVGGGVALALLLSEGPPDPIAPGQPAPRFVLPTLDPDGSAVSLEKVRGRVVLVNFWATWCKPCEEEMPSMQRLYRQLHPEGFELLAISVDRDRDEVRRFRERFGLSFPILLDPDQRAARSYQIRGFPESFLLDGRGRILARYVGPRPWDAPVYVERIRREIEKERGAKG